MTQTPIQKKIEELIKDGKMTWGESMLALAHYIKEETVPEEKSSKTEGTQDWDMVAGFNDCIDEVVDKFKELGL